jgi:hypothetical protein
LVFAWGILSWLLPTIIRTDPAPAPWLMVFRDLAGGILGDLYLIGIGLLALYGFSLARSEDVDVGWKLQRTEKAPAPPPGTPAPPPGTPPPPAYVYKATRQMGWMWALGLLGVAIIIVGIVWLIKDIRKRSEKIRPSHIAKLMKKADEGSKTPQFNVTLDPLYFTLPKKYLGGKELREQWIELTKARLKSEGDYVVESISSVEFYCPDDVATYASVAFTGTKDGKAYEGRVSLQRDPLTVDEENMKNLEAKLITDFPALRKAGVVGDDVILLPATKSKKFTAPFPDGGVVDP